MHPLGPLAFAALIGLPAVASAQDRTVDTPSGPVQVETVAGGLVHPWSLEFLPDGRMLVAERPGRLRIVSEDGNLSEPLGGLPEMFTQGQGGLQDLALAPDFEQSQRVYFTFAEPGQGGASTAVAHGRLTENALEDVQVVFRQEPKVSGSNHFGSRLAFSPDGKLFVALGERFKFEPAQDLSNHLGTIVRINPDGSVPEDNPFVDRQDAEPEIWSYGHRNIESAAIQPGTDTLWVAEMGPRGGDELNMPEPGRNYGWPLVSWGEHYDGRDIPDPPTRPELAQSAETWTPVISPSGMDFYTGDLFSGWQGSMLIGGLTAQGVVRLTLEGQDVADEERIPLGQRIRDVKQGPDGAIYVLTDEDDGEILRLTPAS
ncbi:PQQ-dependent sugar dehydrogenase [Microvirga roseola]|uniref:PQQ-dependent sugar dehydrogenase n=1 Tax=Microvirga roseola TaxID=2883126 RepID=UPI001E325DA2|nr:PQQ-dependent sugar dehydrogenase [Microvirga roseola]